MNPPRISAAVRPQIGHWHTHPNTVAQCAQCKARPAAVTSPRLLCARCALDALPTKGHYR
jgi:hypothetical protein